MDDLEECRALVRELRRMAKEWSNPSNFVARDEYEKGYRSASYNIGDEILELMKEHGVGE